MSSRLEIALLCPNDKCRRLFVATYRDYMGAFTFSASVPWEPIDTEFSESIKRISPDFCDIANQAQKAEHQGWKLIAGPGYRKALEFLVKDYLCRLRLDDAEQIKKAELGKCIRDYVVNERVKNMAARAAWLGNDETHYLRKWDDKDLPDLKKLIALTVHWIEMEELTDTVMKEMPEGKK